MCLIGIKEKTVLTKNMSKYSITTFKFQLFWSNGDSEEKKTLIHIAQSEYNGHVILFLLVIGIV